MTLTLLRQRLCWGFILGVGLVSAFTSSADVLVHTRRVTGVPCLLVPASQSKRVLDLMRAAGWHPPRHSRLVLDRRPEGLRDSLRAFQVCDEAAGRLDLGGNAVTADLMPAALSRAADAANGLRRLIADGTVEYNSAFQMQDFILPAASAGPGEHKAPGCSDAGFIRCLATPRQLTQQAEEDTGFKGHHRSFTFGELFAGIGGFRAAVDMLGTATEDGTAGGGAAGGGAAGGGAAGGASYTGRCLFASEICPSAKQLYALNFGGAELVGAVQGLAASALCPGQAPDLLLAGFPCQPFTETKKKGSGGRRCRGFRDPRGHLFWHMIRLVREWEPSKRPRAILLENVPGLYKNDVTRLGAPARYPWEEEEGVAGGSDLPLQVAGIPTNKTASSALDAVLSSLSMSGYSVSARTYDARLVLPQSRNRCFIVAIRSDLVSARPGSDPPTTTGPLHSDDDPHGRQRAPFCWPELPPKRTSIREILHGNEASSAATAAGTAAAPGSTLATAEEEEEEVLEGGVAGAATPDLEPFRLSASLWEEVRRSSYFRERPEHRLPSLDGPSNTVRASYFSGAKLYSQFVPLPLPAQPLQAQPLQAQALQAQASSSSIAPPLGLAEGLVGEAGGSGAAGVCPYRLFTPRECARLQGFPDSFRLTGGGKGKAGDDATVALESQYRGIGNAVPPPIAAAIARALLDAVIE